MGELERENVGARSRQKVHALLRQSFKKTVHSRVLTLSPLDAVQAPRVACPEVRAFDALGVAKLLEAALPTLAISTANPPNAGPTDASQASRVCSDSSSQVPKGSDSIESKSMSFQSSLTLLIWRLPGQCT